MSDRFDPGDLIVLNQYGFFITPHYEGAVGIIVSKPYSLVTPISSENETFYIVYDVLLNGELFKMIPEEFMEAYSKYEKDTK